MMMADIKVGVAPFGFTIYERKQVFSAHSLITCRSISLPLCHFALFAGSWAAVMAVWGVQVDDIPEFLRVIEAGFE